MDYFTNINKYIKIVESFSEFSENNFDFFMSEQLQTKDNFLTIFSELNTQIKSLTEDYNILKSNLYDNQTAPDVKAKLNHYAELYKDNAFMKKIIKQKEKLIKKLKRK